MGPNLVVRGASVVTAAGVQAADVVVRGGKIAAIEAPGTADATAMTTIEGDGLLLLPGMVDAHVHFQEPGREAWEGFATGSAAAAAGGVTTVVDMPIDCDPPTVTAAAVEAKVAALQRHSRVDVALWGGLIPASVTELDAMAAAGVAGFKAFACPSGWDEFPASDEATLALGLAAGARLGLPVAVHCELSELGHSVESEVAAVRLAARLATAARAHLHVVHTSAAEAVDEARAWPGVSVETCPHYLFLDAAAALEAGAAAHCHPPIRGGDNAAQLWERLRLGMIDTVASDHSPCPPALKEGPAPWAGVDGVGLTLPLLLSDGRLPLTEVVRLTTDAARLLRLGRKGRLAPGFDADLVLVDRDRPWVVGPQTSWTRHPQSPFAGRTLPARVVRTLVRGRTVFTAEHGPEAEGYGRYIHPS